MKGSSLAVRHKVGHQQSWNADRRHLVVWPTLDDQDGQPRVCICESSCNDTASCPTYPRPTSS